MKMLIDKTNQLSVMLISMVLVLGVSNVEAAIPGVTGPNFTITAGQGTLSTADFNTVRFWGYGNNGAIQYPGPTLIVTEGQTINITLSNSDIPEAVSMVFPGQSGVTVSGGVPGAITSEAAVGGTVTYQFTAAKPGTYMYQSGTNMDKQIDMGLIGTIIVRPIAGAGQAYNSADSQFDVEYLYFMSEMDLDIHKAVQLGRPFDTTKFKPDYWFINGRTFPDTLLADGYPILPTQPYSGFPQMHPGQRLLLRVVSAGRDSHPLHPHGNNFDLIARDGRLLESVSGSGVADLAYSDYNLNAQPGSTYDFIFQWTGEKLGWDIYGPAAGSDTTTAHNCTAGPDGLHNVPTDFNYKEYCGDHDKSLDTLFGLFSPELQDIAIGEFYSGSSFLGSNASIPVGEGGNNPFDGYFFPWHSHHEKELTNNDVYPGGMLTFFVVVPWAQ